MHCNCFCALVKNQAQCCSLAISLLNFPNKSKSQVLSLASDEVRLSSVKLPTQGLTVQASKASPEPPSASAAGRHFGSISACDILRAVSANTLSHACAIFLLLQGRRSRVQEVWDGKILAGFVYQETLRSCQQSRGSWEAWSTLPGDKSSGEIEGQGMGTGKWELRF